MRLFFPVVVVLIVTVSPAPAQERVTPQKAKGGVKYGEPWVEVPETFRDLKIPEWPIPTDLKRWQEAGRAQTRATLLQCLGEMPTRPDPGKVKVVGKEEYDEGQTRGVRHAASLGRPGSGVTPAGVPTIEHRRAAAGGPASRGDVAVGDHFFSGAFGWSASSSITSRSPSSTRPSRLSAGLVTMTCVVSRPMAGAARVMISGSAFAIESPKVEHAMRVFHSISALPAV